ncbi:hypothetical protein N9108_09885, partial [Akkermansiaceae bacterium]|nr:hypothetical protein [Akkermansiaceae bacterium]
MFRDRIPLISYLARPASALDLANVLGPPPENSQKDWIKIQRSKTLELFKKYVSDRKALRIPD